MTASPEITSTHLLVAKAPESVWGEEQHSKDSRKKIYLSFCLKIDKVKEREIFSLISLTFYLFLTCFSL